MARGSPVSARMMAAVAVLMVVLASHAAPGGECMEYADYMRPVGVVYSSVSPYDFEYRDGLIYANTWEGFAIYDVRDPGHMSVLSTINVPGWTESIELIGNTAFVMTRDLGLRLIDVTNPRAPQIVWTTTELRDCPASVLENEIIYYRYNGGVCAFDPFLRRIVGLKYLPTSGVNTIGAMAGKLLVGANQLLTVHDAIDTATMRELSRYQAPGYIWGICAQGDAVFLACGSAGVVELSISADGAIREVGRVSLGLDIRRVEAAMPWVYAMGSASVSAIDFGDPAHPVVCGKVGAGAVCVQFHVADNTAYASTTFGILAVDVTNPHDAPLLGELAVPSARDVAVHGDHAYYASWTKGGTIASIADPAHPVLVGPITALTGAIRWVSSLEVRGELMYAATGYNNCLSVLDVSDGTHPRLLGTLAASGLTYDLEVRGAYAFVACSTAGVRIVDVSDPTAPRLASTVLAGESVFGLELAGDRLFAVTGSGTTWLVDVSDPATPGVPQAMPTLEWAQHVHVRGTTGYVVYGGRVVLYDMSDVTNPVRISEIRAENSSFSGVPDMALERNTCYISLGWALQVVDVTDQQHPEFVQFLHTSGYARNAAIIGEYIHVLTDNAGVHIAARQCVDPVVVPVDYKPGSTENSLNCTAVNGVLPVAILGSSALPVSRIDHRTVRCGPAAAAETHANRHGPLRHEEDVDGDGLTDLVFHFLLGETGIQCADTKITITGETYDGLLVTGTDSIRPVSDADKEPVSARGIRVTPNPFNPRAAIAFSLGQAQHVRIQVYDIRGRLVDEVADMDFGAGDHAVEWAGSDATGQDAPSGEYFFRIVIGGEVKTRKAMLLR